jgi:hypothetical protein
LLGEVAGSPGFDLVGTKARDQLQPESTRNNQRHGRPSVL